MKWCKVRAEQLSVIQSERPFYGIKTTLSHPVITADSHAASRAKPTKEGAQQGRLVLDSEILMVQ